MNESGKWSEDKINKEKELLRVKIKLLSNDIPFFQNQIMEKEIELDRLKTQLERLEDAIHVYTLKRNSLDTL
jgi:hypothetical protein